MSNVLVPKKDAIKRSINVPETYLSVAIIAIIADTIATNNRNIVSK
jgi:hypothetical protein